MIWIILFLGLGLRLINLNQSLWLDEAINVLAVRDYSFYNLITQYAQADFHPPGWIMLLWFWTKFFGYSEIAVRVPSIIFGVINIYVVFLIGKKLMSWKVGIVAALLIAINPLHIYYSQEARMYALAALAVSINIFFLIKLIKEEKLNILFLVLTNIMILASDYVAYFIFPAEFILLLIVKKREIFKKWIMALVLAVLIGTWWLPIFMDQFSIGSTASVNLPVWKNVVGAFDFKALSLTLVKFIIGRVSLDNKIIYAFIMLPVSSLFIFLIWRGIRLQNNFVARISILWLVVPLVVATVVSFVVPIYSYFRVLFVLPAFIILITLGIFSFKGKLKYVFLTSVIIIEMISTLTYLFNPSFHREDWRGLVDFLERQNPSIILFESSGVISPFEYYSKGELNAVGALKDFPANDESSVNDLNILLKSKTEVYLVDYLVQISDPNRYVDRKLVELGYTQSGIQNFNGVGFVYKYKK